MLLQIELIAYCNSSQSGTTCGDNNALKTTLPCNNHLPKLFCIRNFDLSWVLASILHWHKLLYYCPSGKYHFYHFQHNNINPRGIGILMSPWWLIQGLCSELSSSFVFWDYSSIVHFLPKLFNNYHLSNLWGLSVDLFRCLSCKLLGKFVRF